MPYHPVIWLFLESKGSTQRTPENGPCRVIYSKASDGKRPEDLVTVPTFGTGVRRLKRKVLMKKQDLEFS
ncbi:hypothetical protein N7530_001522 [Penicillium desertorum]|uniref:Uncharacterized protein n=1 Tax=Penicillium desertorum TaxID=1303715 RepID=A0A9W9XAE5_9EURO|nr:hypothetical protein N7530_001522 [Penicillium desertorum]